MALTINGKRTGRAGADEIRDKWNNRFETIIHEQIAKKANLDRVSDAIAKLSAIDPVWEAWYDSSAVPEFDALNTAEVDNVIAIIMARLAWLGAHAALSSVAVEYTLGEYSEQPSN
jgi:hypothetical protein